MLLTTSGNGAPNGTMERAGLHLANANGTIRGLKDTLAQREAEINFLLGEVRDRVGPAVSTVVTLASSAVAGAIDGGLGDKNMVGPIPINAAIGAGAAVGSVVVCDANLAEALGAIARGFASPQLYMLVRDATYKRFHPKPQPQPQPQPQPAPQPQKPAAQPIA